METKMAPTYATLTLAYLEENLYEIIGKKYGNDIKENFTKSWKRYLDDCFIFWKYPWGDINELHNLQQNKKIYNGIQLKRISIFRYPYKKRKW